MSGVERPDFESILAEVRAGMRDPTRTSPARRARTDQLLVEYRKTYTEMAASVRANLDQGATPADEVDFLLLSLINIGASYYQLAVGTAVALVMLAESQAAEPA